LLVAMIAMSVLGAGGTLSLVGVTAAMHRTAIALSEAVESVRVAEEMRGKVALHARTGDLVERSELEDDVENLIREAETHVSGREEWALLGHVRSNLARYFVGRPTERAEPRDALEAIDRLLLLNVDQSRALRTRAARWDAWATGAGLSSAVTLLVGIVGVIVWLQRSAMRPVLRLRDTAERLGRGEMDMRVPEDGPTEFRDIAVSFNSMAAALASKRKAHMALLGSIAHDMRNPLGALTLSLAALDQKSPVPRELAVQRFVVMANRQMQRLLRLAGDLTDAAQIEAGAMDLNRDVCDLTALVRDACDLFASGSPERRWECHLPVSAVQVLGDRIRLDQVMTNLLSNAIKYSPDAGSIRVALESRGGEVAISVSDEGAGIAPEDRVRLFDPFQRADSARRSCSGAGLGLFISSRIVRAHGGRIEVTSEVGRGSTFTVLLPALPGYVADVAMPLGLPRQPIETTSSA
jgi:signal transduction histidine kinase